MRTETDDTVDQAPSFFWPQAMERGRVGDAAFARAYARVPDLDRARIKTGIAAVFAACGGPMPRLRRSEAVLGHDLVLTRSDAPLDFAVIVCGPRFASPSRLVAAVLPALCAGVPEVAAVRVGGAWPQELLVALELCGVETACRLGPRALAGVWPQLVAKGSGALVLLDGAPRPALAACPGIVLHEATTRGRALVADGLKERLDREALAFAQPDLEFVDAASLAGDAPGALAKDAISEYDAVYVGDGADPAFAEAASLRLGPGRETFWLWPQLPPGAFRRVRIAAARQGDVA